MSVFQLEEYYIYMGDLELTDESKAKLIKLVDDEGYKCELGSFDSYLTIDGFNSELDAESMEEKIKSVLND